MSSHTIFVESRTRTYHGRVGSGRTAGRRGGARQEGTPTEQYAQETSAPGTHQGIEETSPQRLSRSTNKHNPMYLPNPKPGNTTGGSGRSARRSGQAGSGKIRCLQNFSAKKQKSIVPSKAPKTHRFNISPEGRTSETLCKPTEEQNDRLKNGPSPVYPWSLIGTKSDLCSWLLTSGTAPFCMFKPYLCKACPGK